MRAGLNALTSRVVDGEYLHPHPMRGAPSCPLPATPSALEQTTPSPYEETTSMTHEETTPSLYVNEETCTALTKGTGTTPSYEET